MQNVKHFKWTAYPTCIYQCLCLVPLHLHLARFAELSVLRAGLCITVLLIFLINHAACFWCCLLMLQHKKCIKLLEHSVIMLILPADREIYTRIHNMLCNLWFTQNTRASWCWTFGRKPSRQKSTLWYSPYLSSIFNFIMELQLSFSDINIQNDSHLQFHEVMKYLSTRNCTAHSSRKLMRFMKYVDVKCSCRSVALWFVYPNFFNNRATNLQLMWMLLFKTPWICIPVNEIHVNHFETMQVNKTF